LITDFVEIMQQSICDAMVDEMGKVSVCLIDWLISDFCGDHAESICDAMMNEMVRIA
jgi:hypothetical protein